MGSYLSQFYACFGVVVEIEVVIVVAWRACAAFVSTCLPSCLSGSDARRDGSDNSCVGGKDDDDEVMIAMRWCVFMRVVGVSV
jgi:hypothetical protein